MVIVNFIRDKEVGMFARAKRIGKGRQVPVYGLDKSAVGTVVDNGNGEVNVEEESDAAGFDEEESDKSQ